MIIMAIETPRPSKTMGYGITKIIQTTHRSLQLHIPAKVRDNLGLKKGDKMYVQGNIKEGTITFTKIREEEKSE